MKRILVAILLLVGCSLPASAQLYAMRDSVDTAYDFWLYLPEGVHRISPDSTSMCAPKAAETVSEEDLVASEEDPAPLGITWQAIPDIRSFIIGIPARCDLSFAKQDALRQLSAYNREQLNDSLRSTKKPLVLFLHGRSLCGRNLDRVRRYGSIDALSYNRQIDAVVVAPQNPGNWWNPKRLMKIIEWVGERYPIDTNRIYVLGMSLGGYGTLDFAATYPDRTAAAMALCGGEHHRRSAIGGAQRCAVVDYPRHGRSQCSVVCIETCGRCGECCRFGESDAIYAVERVESQSFGSDFLYE